MDIKDGALLTLSIITMAEVTYLLTRLPKTTLKAKGRPVLVDTSVLMDGRIVGIAQSGFIGDTLVIPRSVVGELQFLADHADAEKRSRARRGLDIVTELQNMPEIATELLQDGSKAEEGVDERLLSLAKQHHAAICTLDYNLNKVAVVEGIKVLNINELAQGLRMAHLPGERMMIELVQKGQDSHQGVGYLADGTMVVVEQANSLIGQTVPVEVVRSLQTAAGKMMFARRTDTKTTPTTSQAKKPAVQLAKKGRGAGRKTVATPQQTQPITPATPRTDVKQPSEPRQSNAPRQQQQRATGNNQRPRQANNRRRVDREALLIDLVDKQTSE